MQKIGKSSLRFRVRQLLITPPCLLLFLLTSLSVYSAQVGLNTKKVLASGCELALNEALDMGEEVWENTRHPKEFQNSEMRVGTANIISLYNYEEEWRKRRSVSKTLPLSAREHREIAELQKKHLSSLADFVKRHDLIALQEVDGMREALKFNRDYLNNDYYILFPSGTRNHHGQHNVFLVRKSLNFKFVQTSYTNAYFRLANNHNTGGQLFPHDFLVLEIYDRASGKLVMVVGNTHIKLQRAYSDSEYARVHRKSQLEVMQNILGAYKSTYGSDLPVMLLGDFNENMCTPVAEQKPHYQELTRGVLSFVDVFNLHNIPQAQRATSTHIHKNTGALERNQRDAILLSGKLSRKNVTDKPMVFRYRQAGVILEHPESHADYLVNTFDHFPVSARINLRELRR